MNIYSRVTQGMSDQFADLAATWPKRLSLMAVALSWDLEYSLSEEADAVSLEESEENDRKLVFSGPIQNLSDCKALMPAWLKQQARLYIEPCLQKLSKQCELPYKSVEFRGQKTLWGSCSEGAAISLNYNLLFLPARLLRYVLVHELCHTVHFDHSKAFWQLVERHEPNCRRLKVELKKANQYIPEWLLKS